MGDGLPVQPLCQNPVRHETAQVDGQLHQELQHVTSELNVCTGIQFAHRIEHGFQPADEVSRRAVKQQQVRRADDLAGGETLIDAVHMHLPLTRALLRDALTQSVLYCFSIRHVRFPFRQCW